NQLGQLCQAIPGADVDEVTRALGHDRRIGKHYLKAGAPYGGPCFPRDNWALARIGLEGAEITDILNAEVLEFLANEVDLAAPKGQSSVIGILGLAYKPGTPVVEESASIALARDFKHWEVIVYDPLAMDEARAVLRDTVTYAKSAQECIEAADVVVLMHPDADLLPWYSETLWIDKTVIDPWRIMPKVAIPFIGTHISLGIGPAEKENE
ncbi:unnamed protein product, partial [marine sediment metagenome]